MRESIILFLKHEDVCIIYVYQGATWTSKFVSVKNVQTDILLRETRN